MNMTVGRKNTGIENVIAIVWALCLFSLPFPYLPFNSQTFIALAILSLAYFFKNRPASLVYKNFHFFFVLPFIIFLISFSLFSHASYKIIEKEVATILFPLVTFLLLNSGLRFTQKRYHALLAVFVSSVLILIIFTYIRSFFYPEEFFAHNFLTFDIIHPGYFSLFCGVSVFCIIELNRHYYSRRKWIGYSIIAAILVYMTLLSSRMPLFATLALLAVFLLLSEKTIKTRLLYFSVLIVLIAVMVLMVFSSPRLKYRFYEAFSKNFEMRIVSWKGAWAVFNEHYLAGVGIGEQQAALDSYYLQHVPEPERYLELNAHNYWLHILMTFGIAGALIFVLFWYKLLRVVWVSQHPVWIYATALFIICSLTEVLSATHRGIVFFYSFYSLHLMFLVKQNNFNGFEQLDRSEKKIEI
jgi:O-antigen ligase